MRSNGLATILLMIPVLTVPALAIFGIPQFAPVVASPLDEGREIARESRVGNSARQSRDDVFGDLDGFDTEPADIEEPPPKRRASTGSNANRRDRARRSKEQPATAWGEDPESMSDLSTGSRRRPSEDSDESSNRDSSIETIPSNGSRSARGSAAAERFGRDRQHPSQGSKSDDPIRIVSTADTDRRVVQASFEDDSDFENDRSAKIPARSRANDAPGAKRRESAGDNLTWTTAIERLNQFDIRNFRLEPGHQPGTYIFICSYTPPDNPRVSYRFEAEANEPLKAVEKVLEQIAERRQAR